MWRQVNSCEELETLLRNWNGWADDLGQYDHVGMMALFAACLELECCVRVDHPELPARLFEMLSARDEKSGVRCQDARVQGMLNAPAEAGGHFTLTQIPRVQWDGPRLFQVVPL